MKQVYRVLAYAVAATVAIQAAAIAYAVFGLVSWVGGGGTLDQAGMESGSINFPGVVGFAVHAIGGTMIIPIVVLLFLISSFFAKIPGGIKWALYVVGVTVVQIALGIFAHGLPGLGILHGIVALGMFGVAIMAGMRVSKVTQPAAEVTEPASVPMATA